MINPNDIQHVYWSGDQTKAPLVMLHGHGGSELDMLNLAGFLAPGHPVLGIRGRIIENGVARYFGVKADVQGDQFDKRNFDLDSIETEEQWLIDAIHVLAERYELREDKVIVVGFSNGANLAIHAFLTHPDLPWQGGALLKSRPIIDYDENEIVDLNQKPILITHAEQDPIISQAEFSDLNNAFYWANADVTSLEFPGGHMLSNEEVQTTKRWLITTGLVEE